MEKNREVYKRPLSKIIDMQNEKVLCSSGEDYEDGGSLGDWPWDD